MTMPILLASRRRPNRKVVTPRYSYVRNLRPRWRGHGLLLVGGTLLATTASANDALVGTAAGGWWDTATPAEARRLGLPDPRRLASSVGLAGLHLVAAAGIAYSVISRRREAGR